jgi:uncharacterized protein (DUF362 family)
MPEKEPIRYSRRDFLRWSARMLGGSLALPVLAACGRLVGSQGTFPASTTPPELLQETPVPPTPAASSPPASPPAVPDGYARVAFVRTRDRAEGVRRALALLGQIPVAGQVVLLKPNFNSADPAPASSHPDTLRALIGALQGLGAESITLADRSGMGATRQVMAALGVFDLAAELGCDTLVFDELTSAEDWTLVRNAGDHWQNGYPLPRRLLEAGAVVQTCCLKPHRYGGHFTMSLKNSVGMVGKYLGGDGYNYMSELHNSPYQRLMIAEVNAAYQPALVLLDGVEAFIDNGPDIGTVVWGEVVLAGTDRVAIDAVGLALLRALGYSGAAAEGPLFAQEQLARAAALGLGIDAPEKIAFLTDDTESAAYAARIQALMLASG